jgi:hypothetical protein
MIIVTDLTRWGTAGWKWFAAAPDRSWITECRTDGDGEGLWARMADGTWSQGLGHLQYDLRPAGDDPDKVAGLIRSLHARRHSVPL